MLSFSFSKKEDSSNPVSYVIFFARTPVEVKENEDGEDQGEVIIRSLQQVDPSWVMEHAKQGTSVFSLSFQFKHGLNTL